MKTQGFRRLAAATSFIFCSIAVTGHAQLPGTTAAGVVDLAPGPDISSPSQIVVNPATKRLYALGGPLSVDQNTAIKVIDTATKQIIGGIALARYATSPGPYSSVPNSIRPLGMAIDASAAPVGNKIYVLGHVDGPKFVLRVIDGETNQNLTGEGTDLVLPPINLVQQTSAVSRIVVNPNNHKLYIFDGYGKIIVVAGGAQPRIIGELNPDAGNFLVLSPTANKVFVMGHNVNGSGNPGAVIDSATDTFTSISTAMPNVSAATFNPANNWLYFGGRVDTRWGIFVLHGTTGELLMETAAPSPSSLVVLPTRNALLADGVAYAADTLTFRRKVADNGFSAATGDTLFGVGGIARSPNAIRAVDYATLETTQITVGYRPFGMAANSRTDRLYVTDTGAAELVVLQASTGDVVARAPLPPTSYTMPNSATAPRSVAVSEPLNRVYVARAGFNHEGMIIDVLDGATLQVRSSIVVGASGQPGSPIAIDDTRRRIYVGLAEAGRTSFPTARIKVAVYDADSEALVETLELSEPRLQARLHNMAVNPVLGRLYVLDERTIITIDTTANVVIASQTIATFTGIAVNKRTGKVFVGVSLSDPNSSRQPGDTRIRVLNGLTGAIEAEFAPPPGDYFGMHTLAIDEVSNRMYAAQGIPVANDYESRLHRITAYDGNTYELLGEQISSDAKNILFEPASRKLFVVDEKHGTIAIFHSTTPAEADLLGNISTRASVSGGNGALIGGFIIKGAPGSTKRVLVRAIGPSLGAAGIAGAVGNTTLELHDSAGNIVRNDDWKVDAQTNGSQETQIAATGVPPTNELESAILATLPPGPCTAVVRGKDGAAGVALVEVYDLDQRANVTMANIATRGRVGTGENVMIGGFIVLGSTSSRVLVRAIGPSLTTEIAEALQDPVLELRDMNGGLIDVSDDWRAGRESEIAQTTIPPAHDRESALLATLYPGNYTAIVRGKDDSIGVALVEAYNLN
jgi:DNA-binding beta-propeller fold protein YncE